MSENKVQISSSNQQGYTLKNTQDQGILKNRYHSTQISSEALIQNQFSIRKIKLLSLIFLPLFLGVLGVYFYLKTFKNNYQSYSHEVFNQKYQKQELGRNNLIVKNLNLSTIKDQDIKTDYFVQDNQKMYLKSIIKQRVQQKINFSQLEITFKNNIAHEVFTFPYNSSLQTEWNSRSILNISKEVRQEFQVILTKNQNLILDKAISQLRNCSNKINALQYLYAEQKYQIGKQQQQLPICIFTEGGNNDQNNMKNYFNQIQNLNYSNFLVIYINEFKTEFKTNNFLKYLQSTNMRIKNKVVIINNLQYLGTLANTYFWVQKFCNKQDIVLVLGENERILGRQTLKILNTIYQEKNIWTLSSYIFQKKPQQLSVEDVIDVKNIFKKFQVQKQQKTFHLRSFRKKLLDSIPLQVLVQFKYDNQRNQVWPAFYRSDLNQFHAHMQFDKIDVSKTKNLSQFLISNQKTLLRCQNQKKEYYNLILKLITPLTFNKQLGMKASISNQYKLDKQILKNLKILSQNLFSCQQKNLDESSSNFSYQLKKDIKIFKRKVFNHQYIGQPFGKNNQDMINLSDYLTTPIRDDWVSNRLGETKSKQDAIYILTPEDLNKLVDKFDFWKYKQQLQSKIPYQIWQFKFDDNLEKDLPKLQFTRLKTQEQLEKYIYVDLYKRRENINRNIQITYALGNHMFYHPTNQQVLEAELYYYNKRYKISSKTKQVPICIFTAERNIIKRNQHIQYFDSIERLNYSNYQVLYIDDLSNDGSPEEIYDLVDKKYKRIKNRMRIIHNLQGVSSLGNIYFWTQKFCGKNDIVVNVDADDALLGVQAFKVLSSIYENENFWYVYSKHLSINPFKDPNNPNQYTSTSYTSYQLTVKSSDYRKNRRYLTSHIRSFRVELMKAVPIYQFLEFHYNKTTKMAWPTFQSLSHDITQSHAHVQLAGNQRIKFIDDFLYSYYGSAGDRKCYYNHEKFDHFKELIKTPLQKLQSLYDRGHQIKNNTIIYDNFYDQVTNYNKKMLNQKCYQQ